MEVVVQRCEALLTIYKHQIATSRVEINLAGSDINLRKGIAFQNGLYERYFVPHCPHQPTLKLRARHECTIANRCQQLPDAFVGCGSLHFWMASVSLHLSIHCSWYFSRNNQSR